MTAAVYELTPKHAIIGEMTKLLSWVLVPDFRKRWLVGNESLLCRGFRSLKSVVMVQLRQRKLKASDEKEAAAVVKNCEGFNVAANRQGPKIQLWGKRRCAAVAD